jgi:uncharacterized protein (TIGR03032 family)
MSKERRLEIETSRNFGSWLKSVNASIAFTTYQVGKVFMAGSDHQGKVKITERTFPRCMGLAMKDNTLWMSSIFQIWRLENSLLPTQNYQGYDRVFIPQMAYTTGDLDVHDMIVGRDGNPIFVNTLFNCLSTISERNSFKPIWKPEFISKLAAEDRCHLNGLAMIENEPAYVTLVGKCDVADGWRDHRENGGMVIDVRSDEVVCTDLSMPHSPRVYRDKLWLLEAGTGYFGYVDKKTQKFVRLTFCPGFLRGLTFIGDYAIVGLSKNRENRTFEGLQLDSNLHEKGAQPICGLQVININTGDVVEYLRLEGVVRELYDVMVMPDVKCPLLIGVQKDDIKRMISIEGNINNLT